MSKDQNGELGPKNIPTPKGVKDSPELNLKKAQIFGGFLSAALLFASGMSHFEHKNAQINLDNLVGDEMQLSGDYRSIANQKTDDQNIINTTPSLLAEKESERSVLLKLPNSAEVSNRLEANRMGKNGIIANKANSEQRVVEAPSKLGDMSKRLSQIPQETIKAKNVIVQTEQSIDLFGSLSAGVGLVTAASLLLNKRSDQKKENEEFVPNLEPLSSEVHRSLVNKIREENKERTKILLTDFKRIVIENLTEFTFLPESLDGKLKSLWGLKNYFNELQYLSNDNINSIRDSAKKVKHDLELNKKSLIKRDYKVYGNTMILRKFREFYRDPTFLDKNTLINTVTLRDQLNIQDETQIRVSESIVTTPALSEVANNAIDFLEELEIAVKSHNKNANKPFDETYNIIDSAVLVKGDVYRSVYLTFTEGIKQERFRYINKVAVALERIKNGEMVSPEDFIDGLTEGNSDEYIFDNYNELELGLNNKLQLEIDKIIDLINFDVKQFTSDFKELLNKADSNSQQTFEKYLNDCNPIDFISNYCIPDSNIFLDKSDKDSWNLNLITYVFDRMRLTYESLQKNK